MDKGTTLTREQALDIVRRYKAVIAPQFDGKLSVFLYGSYSKGNARPENDIDVAVVVPTIVGDWLEHSIQLNLAVDGISTLIEPVLIDERNPSPLYEDILKTGIEI